MYVEFINTLSYALVDSVGHMELCSMRREKQNFISWQNQDKYKTFFFSFCMLYKNLLKSFRLILK
jgi:hypothetical protein